MKLRILTAFLCLVGCARLQADQPGQTRQPLIANSVEWSMTTIKAGALTNTTTAGRGADGLDAADVDGDGLIDLTSPWEQWGKVTVSFHPGPALAAQPWPTIIVGTSLSGVEDAQFADVDGDGAIDVVSACECKRIRIHFAPTNPADRRTAKLWTTVEVTASRDTYRWIKVAIADINGDGRLDIVGGGKASPAIVALFTAPTTPRIGSAWTVSTLSPASWTMSLEALDADGDGDLDVVLSDRDSIRYPDGTLDYTLRGSRWLEQTPTGWVNHPIGHVVGGHKFLQLIDFDGDGLMDVIDGRSDTSYNEIFLKRNLGGFASWAVTPLIQPAGVGQYQHLTTCDVNLDGRPDLVVSYSNAPGDLSGEIWLGYVETIYDQTWTAHEISGAPGTKFDNVLCLDLDADGDPEVVTTEQVEQLGIVSYTNPTVP